MDASPPVAPQQVKVALSWLVVAVPLAWGVYNTLVKAAALFH